MTARMPSIKGVPQGKPCGSGTDPQTVTKPCGRTPSRLYPSGWRCDALHKPRPGQTIPGSIFDVPVRVLAAVA